MAIITSNQSGPWHATATWVGGVLPGLTDNVIIATGHNVYIDPALLTPTPGVLEFGSSPSNFTTYALQINPDAIVRIVDNPTVDLEWKLKGNVFIEYRAELQIGSLSVPIPAARKVTLYFESAGHYTWVINMGSNLRNVTPSRFTVYGAPSYHMADADKQRARLASDVSLGTNVTITLNASVDWEVGDQVWLGCAGSASTIAIQASGALIAGYGREQVVIKSKTSATQFVVDLVYNHLQGDMAVHASRNVIIKGDAAQGFGIAKSPRGGVGNEFSHGGINLNWVRFEKVGGADQKDFFWIYQQGGGVTLDDMGKMLAGDYVIKNCVFDGGGSTTATVDSWLIKITGCSNVRVKADDIDMVHTWGLAGIMEDTYSGAADNKGTWQLGRLTCIHWVATFYQGNFRMYARIKFKIKSLWSCSTQGAQNRVLALYGGLEIDELIIHYSYQACLFTETDKGRNGAIIIKSGEIFNSQGGYNEMPISNNNGRRVRIRNLIFRHSYGVMLNITGNTNTSECPDIELSNCSFDNCKEPSDGAVLIYSQFVGMGRIRFRKCTFGMTMRNVSCNVTLGIGTTNNSAYRVVLEDCSFKEPIAPLPAVGKWGKWRHVIISGTAGTIYGTSDINRHFSLEIVRPIVHDQYGVDQWPTVYPGVTHMMLAGGGCDIRNEGTVIVDGTLGLKMTPWSAIGPGAGTFRVPIEIPVKSGKAVTVKVKLRKTISIADEYKRPSAHLRGLNIDTFSIMTNVTDTWEEQTLTGTPSMNGFVSFWVQPGQNTINTVPGRWTESDPGTFWVYADAFSVAHAP